MPGFGFHLKFVLDKTTLQFARCWQTVLKNQHSSQILGGHFCCCYTYCLLAGEHLSHEMFHHTIHLAVWAKTMIAAHETGQKHPKNYRNHNYLGKKPKTQTKIKPTNFQGLDYFCLSRSVNVLNPVQKAMSRYIL